MIQWTFNDRLSIWFGTDADNWIIRVTEDGQFEIRRDCEPVCPPCPSLLAAKALCERVAMADSVRK